MKQKINIKNEMINIPAILWGTTSNKILIAVHGKQSNKEDTVIELVAQESVKRGYHVISFDLPEHGDRKGENYSLIPEHGVSDLKAVYDYATVIGKEISVFGCSLGAYLSLLAYHNKVIKQSLFLSPLVNMESLIHGMMQAFDISEDLLKEKRRIELPIGEVLDWDYYTYVREHPINFEWACSTSILYGANDVVIPWSEIEAFQKRYQAEVHVDENGEHYYHTEEHMQSVLEWLIDSQI